MFHPPQRGSGRDPISLLFLSLLLLLASGGPRPSFANVIVGDAVWQHVVAGGGGRSTSGVVEIEGTAGEAATAISAGGAYEIRSGYWARLGPFAVGVDEPAVPVRHRLVGVQPNPFNPRTTIRFELASPARVRLDLFDVTGRRVTTLLQGHRDAGTYAVQWNGVDASGRGVASGTYYLRMVADGQVATRKLVLLK